MNNTTNTKRAGRGNVQALSSVTLFEDYNSSITSKDNDVNLMDILGAAILFIELLVFAYALVLIGGH